ncbi:hypothetical protein RM780_19390 [Streptomyces sp. DSM 44917]|uniref:Integral membrane protein n=1 Tax=Streptomyces boetiae TaxID=3075541 RepID=A0ABU2LC00_9ACTN|nr:hypothetical protein [Streptomyces sp. DSM 44917]MDT0309108.1 hypothetical protein [Streptomyces sp. DSM 44917]
MRASLRFRHAAALATGPVGLLATTLALAPRAHATTEDEEQTEGQTDGQSEGQTGDQDGEGNTEDTSPEDTNGEDSEQENGGGEGEGAGEEDGACDLISGAARDYCEGDGGSGGGGGGGAGLNDSLDPLSSLARGCADAASWMVNELSDLVNATSNVDFTNASFLRQYAVVFAASTVLTLILWLLAIVKRAIRGVPLTTAISEALGFLWLTVMASAFTPLILYVVVSATDGVTEAIVAGTGDNSDAFFGDFAAALEDGEDIGGGPIMLIVVSLISILAAGVLALELVIRAAMLYVGALLGTAVYAGLVDKNLWSHVRRWAGIMIAVILIKPVIAIVLGLAGALTTDDGPTAVGSIISGLAIILLAIFASAMIYRFVPGFGDEIVSQRQMRQDTASRAAGAALATPANMLRQGMSTHGTRDGGGGAGGAGAPGGGGAQRPTNPLAGGVAAHSARTGQSGPPPGAAGRGAPGTGGAGTNQRNRGGNP